MNRRRTEFEIIHSQFVQMGRIHLAINRVIEKSSFVVIKSAARFAIPHSPEFSGVNSRWGTSPMSSEAMRKTCCVPDETPAAVI